MLLDDAFSVVTGGKLRPIHRFVYLLTVWVCFPYGTFTIWKKRVLNTTFLSSNKFIEAPLYDISQNEADIETNFITNIPNDSSISPVDKDIASSIQQRIRNLPFDFWLREKKKISGKNHACAYFPDIFDLKFNNK